MPSKNRPVKSYESKLPIAGNEGNTERFTGSAGVVRRGKIFEAAHSQARNVTGAYVMPEKGGAWTAASGENVRVIKAGSNKKLSKAVKTDLRKQAKGK